MRQEITKGETVSSLLLDSIVERIREAIREPAGMVPLHAPAFAGNEVALVTECIETGWVSSVGKFVDQFEAEVARACGAKYGVAVVNGTAALEMALVVAGVGRGDEVIMPTLTFVATPNAVHHVGAVPHFVDSTLDTLGLDPVALADHVATISEWRDGAFYNRRTGRRLAAIVPMHVFGQPVDMDGVHTVASEYGLPVIEDAAEALGSRYKGRPCGSLGQVGALSFNGNKILTTGGGGAVVTNDEGLARRAKHLSTTAKRPHRWAFDHDEIGYNYRLPNLNAALGVAQLAQLEERVLCKRRLAEQYFAAFDGLNGGRMFREAEGSQSNYWLNTFLLDPDQADQRDALLDGLNDAGLMCRPVWTLMHRLDIYADCPRAALPVAESIERRLINLPSSAALGKAA